MNHTLMSINLSLGLLLVSINLRPWSFFSLVVWGEVVWSLVSYKLIIMVVSWDDVNFLIFGVSSLVISASELVLSLSWLVILGGGWRSNNDS